jgi:hypothetical protein
MTVVMLGVAIKSIMLSFILLSVITLDVVGIYVKAASKEREC